MRLRCFRAFGALAVAMAMATLAAMTVEGQTLAKNARTTTAVKWTPPRTADGHPDMQGIWANNSVTPLERPRQWEGKLFLTDQELAEVRKLTAEVTEEGGDAVFGDGIIQAALDRVKNPVSYDPGTGNYNHFWLVERDVEDRRTSLITNPADGKLPAMTDAAKERLTAAAAQRKLHPQDNPEDRGLGERCVNFGVPKIGAGYNSYYQVVQAPGQFVFLSEMAHDARIVPVDSRPHMDKKVQFWNGDPRGRWEGDTLVVESTNFSAKSEFRGSSQDLHLVERFTLAGPDTLNYEITVTDPTTWTKAWTALIPLKRSNDAIFEYACHEGNYRSMEGSLKGMRTLEREAAEATKTGTRQP